MFAFHHTFHWETLLQSINAACDDGGEESVYWPGPEALCCGRYVNQNLMLWFNFDAGFFVHMF